VAVAIVSVVFSGLIGILGLGLAIWQVTRGETHAKQVWLRDQRWRICVRLVRTAYELNGAAHTNIQSLEAGGAQVKPESIDYMEELAAARLIARALSDPFKDFGTAWNTMNSELIGARDAAGSLRVFKAHIAGLDAALKRVVDAAESVVAE
jgi:hypothetical protein